MLGSRRTPSFGRTIIAVLLGLCILSDASTRLVAADLSQAYDLFYQGDYTGCIEMCSAEVKRGVWNDGWSRLLMESYFAIGQYEQAKQVYLQVQSKFNSSLPLRFLGAQAFRFCGEGAQARKLLDEIPELLRDAPYRYTDRENRIALARFAASRGDDAREILKQLLDPILSSDPRYVDAYIAIAELALEKSDFQEAAKTLAKAEALRDRDPQIQFLLARAWESSKASRAAEHLARALRLNPRHADSLLMEARNRIDAEMYDDAKQILQSVLETNSKNPIALALLASVAHLQGKYDQEAKLRKQALATWDLNPAVDHTIGDMLSRHYRFAEAVEYQRRAFQMDPLYAPARFRLAQDLLRLGSDQEGWELIKQIADFDRYNVEAYNLRTLQDRLSKFVTLEGDEIWVRMDAREAKIYGLRALELLTEAKRVLEKKYDFQLKHRVVVEIFPQQSDFAIRTFGLPGGAGFLGVCFGNVITANSPASQGENPSNWESVLWHEFCHSITLQKTNNRMPRWLSEGISVYEELERDGSWGQRMNPLYQQMLLGDDFVPLSKLSGAFLNPKSPVHLQFAYFESSLAVRYMIERHGIELLQRLLIDLGMGLPMETALSNRYGQTKALDDDFKRYVVDIAKQFHPQTDFSKPERNTDGEEINWAELLKQKPNNYFAQLYQLRSEIEAKDWSAAQRSANRLIDLYPDDAERGGALELAALVARQQADTATETELLRKLTSLSGDRVPALIRLLELDRQRSDWPTVVITAKKLLAVQPMIAAGHEALVEAQRNLNQVAMNVQPLTALNELKPVDPAGLHYQLAEALHVAGQQQAARIEVLKALEYSPRYREAQKLLVAIREKLVVAKQP